jgi:uncharacterized protein
LMPAIFEIRNTINGKYYWRFKAINGEVVAISEVYETKDGCVTGINSIMSNAVFAAVRDQTI